MAIYAVIDYSNQKRCPNILQLKINKNCNAYK